MVKLMAQRWGRGESPEIIARDNDLSEQTLRLLAGSDAFKAVAEEALRSLKGESDAN